MKRGSKPTFSNIPLKRWLLKVGPVRRRVLLTKFRADLVRLGLSKLAWREGLLQLSSRPSVHLIRVQNREATAQMGKDNHIEDPRLRCKEARTLCDNNNNHFLKQKFSHVSSSSGHRKHRKTERPTEDLERSTSGVAADNSGKVTKRQNSGTTHSSGSEQKKERSQERSKKKKKRKHWTPKKGENPNGIVWRLIPIDEEPSWKPSGQRYLQLREQRKMKWKSRLRAKYLELFGEDIDLSDSEAESLPNPKTHDTFRGPLPKETKTSDERMETEKLTDLSNRKSPIFSHRGKKKRRESHAAGSGKKLKTVDDNERRDFVASDNTSTGTGCDSLLYQEEMHTSHDHDTLITNSTASVLPVGDRAAVNSHNVSLLEPDTVSHIRDGSTTDDADTDKGGESCSENNTTGGDTLDSGSIPEKDIHSDTTDASLETLPVTRHQSVIVKLDKDCRELDPNSSNNSGRKTQLQSTNRQKADLTSRVKIDSTSSSKPAADNPSLQMKNLAETQASLCNRSLKDEIIPPRPTPKAFEWVHPPTLDKKPLKTSSSSCLEDPHENDPKPSSTTDTESSPSTSCDSDRLLGALDNIYLALHCRRRVCERKQVARNLAIKRNRHEEMLKAKQEYESKLIIFREDLGYLFDRLKTRDQVLWFIAQGLDHRTPPGTSSFTAAEVELVMGEAEVQVQTSISKKEASADPPKSQSVGKVLCIIDLTDDKAADATRNPCDSSTDPPRSQNHLNIYSKSEPKDEVDGSCGHDFNANEIVLDLPSIEEVKTISSQQFEKIEEKLDPSSPTAGNDDPCLLCSRTSHIACGQCTKATYCSKVCQEMHWVQSHHATCVPLEGIGSCEM